MKALKPEQIGSHWSSMCEPGALRIKIKTRLKPVPLFLTKKKEEKREEV